MKRSFVRFKSQIRVSGVELCLILHCQGLGGRHSLEEALLSSGVDLEDQLCGFRARAELADQQS